VSVFEKTPILQLVTDGNYENHKLEFSNQLNLFDL